MGSLLNRLKLLRKKAEKLGRKTIRVKAKGKYPTGPRVADVAVYQNDGTPTIPASHFVERAAAAAGDWADPINQILIAFLLGEGALLPPPQIAKDISDTCDRVKTGRLKASFESEIE